MNKHLLKTSIVCGIITASLAGCVEDGYDPQRDGSALNLAAQGTYELGQITDVKTDDSPERYYQIDLLADINDFGGVDRENISIKNMQVVATDPETGEIVTIPNSDRSIRLNGQTLSIDRHGLDNLIDGANVVTRLTFSYWVDNGFKFDCAEMKGHPVRCTDEEIAANPNLRTIQLDVVSQADEPESFALLQTPGTANDVGHEAVIGEESNVLMSFAGDDYVALAASEFTWESSDETVFTVDNGVITGTGLGQATVTASHANYEPQSLDVTVYSPLESFSLNQINVAMEKSKGIQLIQQPDTAAPLRLDDFSIEVVDGSGQPTEVAILTNNRVEGVKEGSAVIQITSNRYPELAVVEANVEVENPVTGFSIASPLYVELNSTATPEFTLEPEADILTQISTSDFNWTITNKTGSATVVETEGQPTVIQGDVAGTATLSTTYNGLTTDDVEIIIAEPLSAIALQPTDELYVAPEGTSGTVQLALTPTPTVVIPQAIAYSAFDWSVTNGTGSATVDENGILTGLTVGTVTVTATSKNYPTVTDSVELNITLPPVVENLARIEVKDSAGNLLTEQAGQYQISVARCNFVDITPVAVVEPGKEFGTSIAFTSASDSTAADLHLLDSADGNDRPHRIVVNENAQVGSQFTVAFDLKNYAGEQDQFVTVNVTENLMCSGEVTTENGDNTGNNGAIILNSAGELKNWSVWNPKFDTKISAVASEGNGPGLGHSLKLETGTKAILGNNQVYSPLRPGGFGIMESLKDPNQTWKVSYWVRVTDGKPEPVDVSMRIDMKTDLRPNGSCCRVQAYQQFDHQLDVSGEWVKYEHTYTGMTLQALNDLATGADYANVDDLDNFDGRWDLYVGNDLRVLEIDNVVIERVED
ncbi:Ig-like domain-containing surface protein [Catenovulum agarivorans DS-2]|uniref:Ig-like domain-containing surface protein n=1 Tax=Catenovulum agarivorans DS-2 TaxID=1328313 RepID=W7QB55_9ALTE|nr:Ig-like domain-containing protein [Catenovulum agarivorans]EWH09201.1 Ig-like domain-containing surface protein [Catenovulum agarivorans DS-2]